MRDELIIYGHDEPPWGDASIGYSKRRHDEGTTFRRLNKKLVAFDLDKNGDVVGIERSDNDLFPKER